MKKMLYPFILLFCFLLGACGNQDGESAGFQNVKEIGKDANIVNPAETIVLVTEAETKDETGDGSVEEIESPVQTGTEAASSEAEAAPEETATASEAAEDATAVDTAPRGNSDLPDQVYFARIQQQPSESDPTYLANMEFTEDSMICEGVFRDWYDSTDLTESGVYTISLSPDTRYLLIDQTETALTLEQFQTNVQKLKENTFGMMLQIENGWAKTVKLFP